jgi:hypothetical protein
MIPGKRRLCNLTLITQTRQVVLCGGQNMLGRTEIVAWEEENQNKGSKGNTDSHDQHKEEHISLLLLSVKIMQKYVHFLYSSNNGSSTVQKC